MNNNIRNTFRLGVMAVASVAAMVSCTDTWNEHYEEGSSIVYNGTTMKALEESASDFAAVVKAVGFDRELNSSNVYTIWAPQNINKDSLLALAKTDSAAVVDRFIKNHISRFAISDNGTVQEISLMSAKKATMTASMFSTSALVKGKTNISCDNGVIHMIDGNINYQHNIFELIEKSYTDFADDSKAEMGGSLYAFLKAFNSDSLDEKRSVSRGVDENGEKIWVDSVVIRNNTALVNMDAAVYEEDSSFIAIIPSIPAYQKRYAIYKNLLKFNPSEDAAQVGKADSLQNYYANMFAMEDLYFNVNANEHIEDSLKSTSWRFAPSPYGVYYRKDKKNQPADRPTHDILAGLTPTDCSNGTAYLVEDYPMSVTEQSFRKIELGSSNYPLSMFLSKETNDQNAGIYTKNTGTVRSEMGNYDEYGTKLVPVEDEEGIKYVEVVDSSKYIGSRNYQFLDIEPQSPKVNPFISFFIPNTLSGLYDIYLVTVPIWGKTGFKNGQTLEDDPRAYRFYTYVWERVNDGNNIGKYPASGTRLTPIDPTKLTEAQKQELGDDTLHLGHSTGNYYVTDPTNKVDTLYIGSHEFKNTYYGLGLTEQKAGAMIQLSAQISTKLESEYSREMLISKLILKPKYSEADEPKEAKRRR